MEDKVREKVTKRKCVVRSGVIIIIMEKKMFLDITAQIVVLNIINCLTRSQTNGLFEREF